MAAELQDCSESATRCGACLDRWIWRENQWHFVSIAKVFCSFNSLPDSNNARCDINRMESLLKDISPLITENSVAERIRSLHLSENRMSDDIVDEVME